jgi:hypothetical protein
MKVLFNETDDKYGAREDMSGMGYNQHTRKLMHKNKNLLAIDDLDLGDEVAFAIKC